MKKPEVPVEPAPSAGQDRPEDQVDDDEGNTWKDRARKRRQATMAGQSVEQQAMTSSASAVS